MIGAGFFGSVSGFASRLAATAGASLIGFAQAGAGAVQRTVQDCLRDSIEAAHFGVKADGVTIDTAAWNAAITFAALTGGIVRAPRGVSIINATLNLPAGVAIVGRGRGETALVQPTKGSVLSYTGAADAVSLNGSCAGVERMAIVGTAGAAGAGLKVNGSGNVVESWCARHVTVYGFTGGVGVQLWADNNGAVAYGEATSVRVRNAKKGLHIYDVGGAAGFSNTNQFHGGGISGGNGIFDYAIHVQGGNDNRVTGMSIEPYTSTFGHIVIERGELKFNGRLEGQNQPTSVPLVWAQAAATNTSEIRGLGGAGLIRNECGCLIEMTSGKHAEPVRQTENLFANPGFAGVDTTAHTIPGWTVTETGAATTWTLSNLIVVPGHQTIQIDVPAGANCELKPSALVALPDNAARFVTFGLWVKTALAQSAFARINAQAGVTSSGVHSGSGNWEAISMAQGFTNAASADPRFELPGGGAGGTFYITSPYFTYGAQQPRNVAALKTSGGVLYGMIEGGATTLALPAAATDNAFYTTATQELTIPKWGNVIDITTNARNISRVNNVAANRLQKGTITRLVFDVGGITVVNSAFITLTAAFTSAPTGGGAPANSAARSWLELYHNGDGTCYELNRRN